MCARLRKRKNAKKRFFFKSEYFIEYKCRFFIKTPFLSYSFTKNGYLWNLFIIKFEQIESFSNQQENQLLLVSKPPTMPLEGGITYGIPTEIAKPLASILLLYYLELCINLQKL